MPRGPDISEHQRTFPDGAWDFVIIRVVNESGRVDHRWRAHKAEADRRGIPAGAYVIVDPDNISADSEADRFLRELRTTSWGLIPWVDVELPGRNLRGYVQRVRDLIKQGLGGGVPVGGYYSAGSSYRQQTADLFDRQWLASWGSGFPRGADIHQYQGSPLDLNFAHSLDAVRWGSTAPPPPGPRPGPAPQPQPGGGDDLPYSEGDLVRIFGGALLLALRGGNEVRAELADIFHDSLLLSLKGDPEVQEAVKKLVREAE